jgi:lysine-specific histone demethylase 1
VQDQDDGDELTVEARRCIITASIGALRAGPGSGGIDLCPLPPGFEAALAGLGMGSALRVVLRFERAPWPEPPGDRTPTFIHVPGMPFDTFWRQAEVGQEQLTAWAGGPKAAELSLLDDVACIDSALRSLARATQRSFVECKDLLLGVHSHDFSHDPLTQGAYSYVRPGMLDPAHGLRESADDTLFFAGEALDLRYPGTVAGALGSGEHASRKLLTSWDR